MLPLQSGSPACDLIMTAADLPQPVPRFGPQTSDRPILAVGETKYHGEPVALVAAETKEAAEEAARLVRVEHEELPAVFTLAGALDPSAPLVQDSSLRPKDPLATTNVFHEHRIGWGDVDAARADLVIENTYTFPMVTHFAIEPLAFMAAPDGDGIAVWSSIQHPNWLQKILSNLLDCPSPRSGCTLRIPAAGSAASSMRSSNLPWRSPRYESVGPYASS